MDHSLVIFVLTFPSSSFASDIFFCVYYVSSDSILLPRMLVDPVRGFVEQVTHSKVDDWREK